jgi:flagellar biosynthesis protein FliR
VNAVPAFDLFAAGSPAVLTLFGARVSGLVMVAPVFSARNVPVMVKTSLVVLFTILLQPVAMAFRPTPPLITPGTILGEILVGFAIGLGAAVLVGAAEAAGELLAIQIGLSGAAIVDPLTNSQGPALGPFMQLFVLTILLGLDAHLVMLDAVASSVQHLPVGSTLDLSGGAASMVSLGSTLFALGLRFAAPVVAAVLIANVALAVLSRVAPQLNILSVAFPIQIAIGLFALAASLPFIARWFGGWQGAYGEMLMRVIGAFTGAGGR